MLDPDRFVEKPRRHGALHNPLAYGLGPRTNLLISDQGHRRDLARQMAFLALILQNWDDILGERGLRSRQLTCHQRSPNHLQDPEADPGNSPERLKAAISHFLLL